MNRKSDARLKHEVETELSWDTKTWDQKIGIEVHDGIVTLNGAVSTYAQKVAAQSVAHRIKGVTDVANELSIHPRRKYTDAQVARTVRRALRSAALIPDERVTTTVTDGWVKLEGKVESLTQRFDAEWVVENLVGVAGVVNEFEVDPPGVDALKLRQTIEQALERRADREAERLRIDIIDGEVELYGRVHSWPERDAVVGCISHAPGVRKVNDNLRIDPYF